MSLPNLSFMQKTIVQIFAYAAMCIVSSNAMATYITYETRQTDSGINTSDYQASWNAQTSAISSGTLGTFANITAPGSDYHSHLQVMFEANSTQNWLFQIATDAGHGGALYMNNALVDHSATDLWWGYNWNNMSEMLVSTGALILTGTNVLDVYWAEGCCNGGQSGRFSIDGGQNWMALSTANLNSAAVPEPGMLMLFAGGLLGLALARRKQRI